MVTGTSPNICGGIAEVLSEAGASVCAVDLHADLAASCARYLEERGGRAVGLTADVTVLEEAERAVRRAIETFGSVDILVNGAVSFGAGGVLDIDIDQWQHQLDVILTGALVMTRSAAAAMIQRGTGGSVINIASTAAHQGEPGNIAYSSAKAGLLNFTRAAAMDLACHGIRVNSVTPTTTDPWDAVERAERWGLRDVHRPSAEELAGYAGSRERLPLGALPTGADYGHAVEFLASDGSRMVTGIDLRVDAGAVARYWRVDPPRAAMGVGVVAASVESEQRDGEGK